MKYCRKCNRTLEHSQFSKNKNRSDGLQSQCKECLKTTNQSHYQKSYKDTQKEHNKKNKIFRRSLVEKIKSENPCPCGESDRCCLDFHHLHNKKLLISKHKEHGNKKLLEEISKCCVICANCHRKIHAKHPVNFDINSLVAINVESLLPC